MAMMKRMPQGQEAGQGLGRDGMVTTPPHTPGRVPSPPTDGEVPGTGSTYRAMLVERPNKSNNRNMGPTGAPSEALERFPMVTMNERETGRVSMRS